MGLGDTLFQCGKLWIWVRTRLLFSLSLDELIRMPISWRREECMLSWILLGISYLLGFVVFPLRKGSQRLSSMGSYILLFQN